MIKSKLKTQKFNMAHYNRKFHIETKRRTLLRRNDNYHCKL